MRELAVLIKAPRDQELRNFDNEQIRALVRLSEYMGNVIELCDMVLEGHAPICELGEGSANGSQIMLRDVDNSGAPYPRVELDSVLNSERN